MQNLAAIVERESCNTLQQNATVEAEILPAKQQTAIFALLTEPTLEAAAKVIGVQRTTLWRWLQEERFYHAYQQALRESVKQTFARLQKVSHEAVDCLLEVMQQQTAPPSARVTAAKAVLDYTIKAVELEDIQYRLEELERKTNIGR